jgi:hypothetical protein
MNRWMKKLYPLACGGVTLGILQGLQAVDFNQIWYQLLYTILNALVTLLLGGEAGSLTEVGAGSLFGSFFL